MNLFKQTATELVSALKTKQTSAVELCSSYLKKIADLNPELNAFISFNSEAVLKRAQTLDDQKEKKGKLHGLPIAVKDNFCVTGTQTTAGSKMLEHFISPYTATCIEKLEREGAIVIGKTNMDEFAMGSSNENSFFGPCKNPWNLKYVPGGSSGGSAAAVAAGLSPVAIGSDTGGSIRQPASYCGVVGIKPTYGSISRYGLIAFASSLDQAGPIARNVSDAALILDVMIDRDEKDSTSVDRKQPSLAQLKKAAKGSLKIGLPKEYFSQHLEKTTQNKIKELLENLQKDGFQTVELNLSLTEMAIPVYYIVASSEASSNLSRFDGVRYGFRNKDQSGLSDLSDFYKKTRSVGFGDEVKRRILLGTYSLSSGYYDEYYIQAARVRRLMANEFTSAFKKCDVILTPTAIGAAFPLGDQAHDPIKMYFNDIYTVTANLCGLPAISLPLGLDDNKLPIGVQLMAPLFAEKAMLEMALAIEDCVQFKGLTQ